MAQSQADIQRRYRERQKTTQQHTVVNSTQNVIQLELFCVDNDAMHDDDDTPPNPRQLFQGFGDLDVFCEQPQWYQRAVESISVSEFGNLSDDTITALLRNELTPDELVQVFKRVGRANVLKENVHHANSRSTRDIKSA